MIAIKSRLRLKEEPVSAGTVHFKAYVSVSIFSNPEEDIMTHLLFDELELEGVFDDPLEAMKEADKRIDDLLKSLKKTRDRASYFSVN